MVIRAHIEEQPHALDDRREPRRAMQLETQGALEGGVEANVTVHNLSTSGLLFETELPLAEDEVLAIALPEIGTVEARIVWHSDRLFGGEFDRPLSDAALAAARLQGSFSGFSQSLPASSSEPFGARLNRLRRDKGMTLAQVAEALDVSKPTVWAWEKGKAKPLPERIDAIAEALGVSGEELGDADKAGASGGIVQDCRQRIAVAYGIDPSQIRIMIEV